MWRSLGQIEWTLGDFILSSMTRSIRSSTRVAFEKDARRAFLDSSSQSSAHHMLRKRTPPSRARQNSCPSGFCRCALLFERPAEPSPPVVEHMFARSHPWTLRLWENPSRRTSRGWQNFRLGRKNVFEECHFSRTNFPRGSLEECSIRKKSPLPDRLDVYPDLTQGKKLVTTRFLE